MDENSEELEELEEIEWDYDPNVLDTMEHSWQW